MIHYTTINEFTNLYKQYYRSYVNNNNLLNLSTLVKLLQEDLQVYIQYIETLLDKYPIPETYQQYKHLINIYTRVSKLDDLITENLVPFEIESDSFLNSGSQISEERT